MVYSHDWIESRLSLNEASSFSRCTFQLTTTFLFHRNCMRCSYIAQITCVLAPVNPHHGYLLPYGTLGR
jgi:hypothetical protein